MTFTEAVKLLNVLLSAVTRERSLSLSLRPRSTQGHRGAGVQRTEGLHGDEQYLI